MEYDFTKFQVHKHQVMILRRTKRCGSLLSDDLDVSALFSDELIQPTQRSWGTKEKEIELTDKGRLFLQWRWEDAFRHRWPVYLSIAAFVVSVIALVKSFLN